MKKENGSLLITLIITAIFLAIIICVLVFGKFTDKNGDQNVGENSNQNIEENLDQNKEDLENKNAESKENNLENEMVTKAKFAVFVNDLTETQLTINTECSTLMRNQAMNGTTRTNEQIYNYVARGEDLNSKEPEMLSRTEAEQKLFTKINVDKLKQQNIEISSINVMMEDGTTKEATYYITNQGNVFVWPPYCYEDELYVTNRYKVVDNKININGIEININELD